MSRFEEMFATFQLTHDKQTQFQSIQAAHERKHQRPTKTIVETVVFSEGERTVTTEEKRDA